MKVNALFVLVLGMGTVFVGLICLIYITKLMSFVIRRAAAPASAAKELRTVPEKLVQRTEGERELLPAIIIAALAAYGIGTEVHLTKY